MDELVFSDDERESIIVSIMATHQLRRADAERIFEAVGRPAKRNPFLERQWVHTLFSICTALKNGEARPGGLQASLFWIRLYGVLTELLARFENVAGLESGAPTSWKYYGYFAACTQAFDACIAIRDSLSDDELVYAAFLRHVHAHVYQTGFEYDVERGNPALKQPAAVRTKQMVPTVRRHVSVDEVHELVDRMVQSCGGDESQVLLAFVGKIGAAVDKLEQALVELEKERSAHRMAG